MRAAELNRHLERLGYRLVRNRYCVIRHRKVPFSTVPHNQPGSVCVHDDLPAVEEYIRRVEQVRQWQEEVPRAD